jgi:hypothetical protein
VHQAALVGVLQAERRLPRIVASLDRRQRSARLQQPGQIDAVDELHDEEMGVADLAGVVQRHNVRVGEPGRGLGLAAEALQQPLLR